MNFTTLDDSCNYYSTWIIKYNGITINKSIYLIWYTDSDEDSTDKLLTYTSGEIYSTTSLNDLIYSLYENLPNLNEFDNLKGWIESIKDFKTIECTTYNIKTTTNSIKNNNLDISTLEDLANFINLYGDFAVQDDRNNYLLKHKNNKCIEEAWEYFYNYIFWPRFNDKEKFEAWKMPKFKIDIIKLLDSVITMAASFEKNIK